ncbi:von Willebrand domain-containing protein [Beauveria bassiana ARSEF 2860]|uniref:von Willebrand domain-containing protein n=1 Tax=Beauveria bassiana (strain ARSEF 2860) TaxID=655819 RepID=J4KR71_BEAB2|nr:von Willebrand domain-containing protein [Beauveria bassiana ARSEF 2860]EJP70444.1 von Willebrand domain-containing protein [Beauveria bassiana ARSEF 2860]
MGYPLLNSRYHSTVKDIFVEGTLVETSQAQTNVEREVTYIFKVPLKASVISFTAKVGNTVVKAIMDEKAKADKKYQAAKMFQISLGAVSPNSTIKVRVTYVYIISSNTIKDSVRLTIPAGLAARPGAGPTSVMTIPTALTSSDAVIITISIKVNRSKMIFNLNCLTHHASITNNFSNNSFKALPPIKKRKHHFILSWTVPRIDQAHYIVKQLSPPLPGQSPTLALALTLVSNLRLSVEEHEYIFLVDYSGSIEGSRIKMANSVVETMLNQLPSHTGSTFNIYNFNTSAWSIVAGGKSVIYNKKNVSTAVSNFQVSATGGTNIDAALTTGVTAAMRTVQQHAATAAGQSKLLRVFVIGLGNDVSRGMCEGLARAGAGATAYISKTLLQDRDHGKEKAETLINAINYAPVHPAPAKSGGGGAADGENQGSRPKPNQAELGAVAKGDNLPPPKAAIRSYWYAIVDGASRDSRVTINYDIPGSGSAKHTIKVGKRFETNGRLIHRLAAHALIQTFKQKLLTQTNQTDKY